MSVLETLTFRLVPGTDEEDFLAADRAVQTELIPNQAGFIRRTTARGTDGEWVVVTLWWSVEQAEAYHRLTGDAPVARRFISFAEADSLRWGRYLTLD